MCHIFHKQPVALGCASVSNLPQRETAQETKTHTRHVSLRWRVKLEASLVQMDTAQPFLIRIISNHSDLNSVRSFALNVTLSYLLSNNKKQLRVKLSDILQRKHLISHFETSEVSSWTLWDWSPAAGLVFPVTEHTHTHTPERHPITQRSPQAPVFPLANKCLLLNLNYI